MGIVVDSAFVAADLVVDATGRAGRLSTPFRPLGQRVDCGMAYAARRVPTALRRPMLGRSTVDLASWPSTGASW